MFTLHVVDYITFIYLVYGEYLGNTHFGDILHTFIPHFTLHSAEKLHIEFSANYPSTTFRIPRSAKYPFSYTNTAHGGGGGD